MLSEKNKIFRGLIARNGHCSIAFVHELGRYTYRDYKYRHTQDKSSNCKADEQTVINKTNECSKCCFRKVCILSQIVKCNKIYTEKVLLKLNEYVIDQMWDLKGFYYALPPKKKN